MIPNGFIQDLTIVYYRSIKSDKDSMCENCISKIIILANQIIIYLLFLYYAS